jgi:hypothetical protein
VPDCSHYTRDFTVGRPALKFNLLGQKVKVSNSDRLIFPIINGGDEHFFSLFQVI